MQLTLAVPNRNGAEFLEHTLRSLDANGPCVRWWLQDGASTDDSVAIARNFLREGDHIEIATDTGQTDALNRAFARMGGDVIGFINSDDCLAPGAAAAVLEFFSAHPDIDLVYGEVEWCDAHGTITGRHAAELNSVTDILDIYRVWWSGRQWVQPEVFFRRSLWERVRPFDTAYHLAFDYDFWVRCFLAGARVARLPRVLAQFRIHAAQKSRAAEQAAREIRSIAERHLPFAPVSSAMARRVRAQIDYERYWLGEEPYAGVKPSFARYLATHPNALALPEIRARLRGSLGSMLRPKLA